MLENFNMTRVSPAFVVFPWILGVLSSATLALVTVLSSLIFPSLAQADFPRFSGRIINGSDAARGEFPWMVSLQIGPFSCGGALIGPRDVLTAAHCITTGSGGIAASVVARHGILSFNESGTSVNSARIFRHPSYDPRGAGFDVAVVRLASDLPGPYLKLGSASEESNFFASRSGNLAAVMGWGLIESNSAGLGPTAFTLQKLRIPYIDIGVCQRGLASEGFVDPDTMLCAGVPTGNSARLDSCLGDSGGPLVVGSGANAAVIGVVSWGRAECDGYGVYSRVVPLASWIRDPSAESTPTIRVQGAIVNVRGNFASGGTVECQVIQDAGGALRGLQLSSLWGLFDRSLNLIQPWRSSSSTRVALSGAQAGSVPVCVILAKGASGTLYQLASGTSIVRSLRKGGSARSRRTLSKRAIARMLAKEEEKLSAHDAGLLGK